MCVDHGSDNVEYNFRQDIGPSGNECSHNKVVHFGTALAGDYTAITVVTVVCGRRLVVPSRASRLVSVVKSVRVSHFDFLGS